jgi:hypothetical protein
MPMRLRRKKNCSCLEHLMWGEILALHGQDRNGHQSKCHHYRVGHMIFTEKQNEWLFTTRFLVMLLSFEMDYLVCALWGDIKCPR